MDGELADLCQQANILNLNYIVAKTSGPDLQKLESIIGQLEARVNQVRAKLQEEADLLAITSNATKEILAKVKNKPLPSALKTRFGVSQQGSTPSRTPARQKAVSFDIKSSPLSLSQSTMDCQLGPNSSVGKLSQEEFDQIPKYMKGRLTMDKVNTLIDLLNQLYADKYAVMNQNPNKLPHEFRQRYWDWKEADCEEVQDRCFITENDIKNSMQSAAAKQNPAAIFKLDPLGRSILAILRHFGRIREVRTPGIVRFVIL